jgi:acyl CoA:acetate/3-ketoacid CoA transferase beta subunit
MAYLTGTSDYSMKVGNAAFFVSGQSNKFIQTNNMSVFFAGVVQISLLNLIVLPTLPVTATAGTTLYVVYNGDTAIYLAKANESGAYPLVGSSIYAMNDGTFQSQIPSAAGPAWGILTQFKVKSIPTGGWTAGGYIVVTY